MSFLNQKPPEFLTNNIVDVDFEHDKTHFDLHCTCILGATLAFAGFTHVSSHVPGDVLMAGLGFLYSYRLFNPCSAGFVDPQGLTKAQLMQVTRPYTEAAFMVALVTSVMFAFLRRFLAPVTLEALLDYR